jgi:hypothetical protein
LGSPESEDYSETVDVVSNELSCIREFMEEPVHALDKSLGPGISEKRGLRSEEISKKDLGSEITDQFGDGEISTKDPDLIQTLNILLNWKKIINYVISRYKKFGLLNSSIPTD